MNARDHDRGHAGRAGAAPRIVVVDDDKQVAELIARFLLRAGYSVGVVATAREALALVERWPADLLVSDLIMPDMDGIELLREVRERFDVPVVAMSGGATLVPGGELLKVAGHLGAAAVVSKPLSADELLSAVEAALA